MLGACPNVSCKISGLITESDWQHWLPEQIIPYIDTVVNAFGMQRVLFGSDWPVCRLAGSYAAVVRLVQDYFSPYAPDEQEAFWANNAIACYGLAKDINTLNQGL